MWLVGKKKERIKKWSGGVRGWWGKKKGKKKKKDVIIKIKSKNQNYVPNTIFFFLIVILVVKPKLWIKQIFFYNLEFKSRLKFQLQYWKKSRNWNKKRKDSYLLSWDPRKASTPEVEM